MGFFNRDGSPRHDATSARGADARAQQQQQPAVVPPEQPVTSRTAGRADKDWDALRDVWHSLAEAFASTGPKSGIFLEQPQVARETKPEEYRNNAQDFATTDEEATKTQTSESRASPPDWRNNANTLRILLRALLELEESAGTADGVRGGKTHESAGQPVHANPNGYGWDYAAKNDQESSKSTQHIQQQERAQEDNWWITYLQKILPNDRAVETPKVETFTSVKIGKAENEPTTRSWWLDNSKKQELVDDASEDYGNARTGPKRSKRGPPSSRFESQWVAQAKQYQPIFPTVQPTGSRVVTAFWATIFVLLVALCVTLSVLKKSGGFVSFVITLERITRLNLGWLLVIWDVDATADYLKANSHRQRRAGQQVVDVASNYRTTESRVPPTPQVEPAADTSGHPRRGRRLFDDPYTPHAQPQFNSFGWKLDGAPSESRHSSNILHSLFAYAASTVGASGSPTGVLPDYAASVASPAVDKRPAQQHRPPLGLTIVPRVRYPIRADPDFPALHSLPGPVAAMLDFAEETWDVAVDTAAWGYAATVVLPREYVGKKVGSAVATGREWVEWGGRYGRQTVKRALGYSDKKQVSFAEKATEKIPKTWFA
ncbi:hypothetical protein HDU83_007934 [Entophlyctis luteolus]|nr:hypothetical protein HDU83_007934 [Entophlyctis luteolus]